MQNFKWEINKKQIGIEIINISEHDTQTKYKRNSTESLHQTYNRNALLQNSLDTWMTGSLNGFLWPWQKFKDLGQWKSSWHEMGFYKTDVSINYKEELQQEKRKFRRTPKKIQRNRVQAVRKLCLP